jgi:hypothetical protein
MREIHATCANFTPLYAATFEKPFEIAAARCLLGRPTNRLMAHNRAKKGAAL